MNDSEIAQKPEKEITIIINGRPKEVEKEKITFQEVVVLAFGEMLQDPNVVYTVTYSKGHNPDKGIMVEGNTINTKQGMNINVTKTTKS